MPVIIHLDARSSNAALRLSGIRNNQDLRLLGLHWRFGKAVSTTILVVDYGKDGGRGLPDQAYDPHGMLPEKMSGDFHGA